MSEELAVFGFGSYFHGQQQYGDVDILIVHARSEAKSCEFAIRCKRHLLSCILDADITILSENEEQNISFIKKSGALYIGRVNEQNSGEGLNTIMEKIHQANARDIWKSSGQRET